MKSVFFGPSSLSGIGQVTRKYCNLVGGDFIEYGQDIGTKKWEIGFAFVLPVPDFINVVNEYKRSCKRMIYYTICETEPVNEEYGKLLDLSKTIWTSSVFCSDILKKQFPTGNFPVLHLFAPPPVLEIKCIQIPKAKYIFYHIGNILDPRKNINKLIECFYRAEIPDSLLVLKASCKALVKSLPGVYIINEFFTPNQMESLHDQCHCYVSFSHSEGVGMGAVEAALRNKPVIFQKYGGTEEYIPNSPYVIDCSMVPVGQDDFLFLRDHMWGEPSMEQMIEYMQYVAKYDIKTWDHQGTRNIMDSVSKKMQEIFL